MKQYDLSKFVTLFLAGERTIPTLSIGPRTFSKNR